MFSTTQENSKFTPIVITSVMQFLYCLIIGLVLLICPHAFLTACGWTVVDVISARLVSMYFITIALASLGRIRSQKFANGEDDFTGTMDNGASETHKNDITLLFTVFHVGNTIVALTSIISETQTSLDGLITFTVISFIFSSAWVFFWGSQHGRHVEQQNSMF